MQIFFRLYASTVTDGTVDFARPKLEYGPLSAWSEDVFKDWAPSAWVNLTLINGWVTDTGAADRARFRRIGPFLQLQLVITRPGGATTLSPFTLPVGSRPPDVVAVFGTDVTAVTARSLLLTAAGDASLNNASYDSIAVSGGLIYVGY
jgi:hypothetical protein